MATHPEWDAAAAQALVDYPTCCVLLDVPPDGQVDTLNLLEYVRLSAPDAPIVILTDADDEALARERGQGRRPGLPGQVPRSRRRCSAARSSMRSSASARRPTSPTWPSTTS